MDGIFVGSGVGVGVGVGSGVGVGIGVGSGVGVGVEIGVGSGVGVVVRSTRASPVESGSPADMPAPAAGSKAGSGLAVIST